jgi:hypothetical protein
MYNAPGEQGAPPHRSGNLVNALCGRCGGYLAVAAPGRSTTPLQISIGHGAFRLLGFFDGRELVVLTNSFQKKTQ